MGALRTIFALAVALGHLGGFAFFQPMNGNVAVQSFYIVSGFYMALVYNEKYASYENPKTVFWLSRYLRLAPAFLAVALVSCIALGPGLLRELPPSGLTAVLFSQVTLIGLDIPTFVGYDRADGSFFLVKHLLLLPDGSRVSLAENMPVPQGWTLGVETWFYLLVPLLVTRKPRAIAAVLAGCLALHIAGFYAFGLRGDPWTYRFFPFELALFLSGGLAYHGLRRLRDHPLPRSYAQVIFAAMLLLSVFYYYLPGGKAGRGWVFFILLAASLPFVFQLTKDSVVDRWIGDFSYPIYLVHLLCFRLVPDGPSAFRTGLVRLLIMILAAFVIVIAIEHPIDRFRHLLARQIGRRGNRPAMMPAISG